MTTCEIDLRVGGKCRFLQRTCDGREVGFHGEYREIVAPERIVQTWIFDPFPPSPAIETWTLEDHGDRTKLVILAEHDSVATRDNVIKSGMERGVRET